MVALAAATVLSGCAQSAGTTPTPSPTASATPSPPVTGGPLRILAGDGLIAAYAPRTKPWRGNFAVNVCVQDGAARSATLEEVIYRRGPGKGDIQTKVRTATAKDIRRGNIGFGSDIGPLKDIPREYGGKLIEFKGTQIANRCRAQSKDGESQIVTSLRVGKEGLRIEGFDLIYVSDGQRYKVSSAFAYIACGSRQQETCKRSR